MGYERQTTVTKCPACSSVFPGLPNECPKCGHRFADMQATLPQPREATTAFDSKPVREVLDKKRPIPKHVSVPFLAGLLVAVLVVIFIRLSATDHRSSRSRPWRASGGVITPEAAEEELEELRMGPREIPALPSRIVIENPSDQPPSQHDSDALLDGNPDTCFFPLKEGRSSPLVFQFNTRKPFSRVVLGLGCGPGPDGPAPPTVQAHILTEDGKERRFRVPVRNGQLSYDLAGHWSASLRLWFEETPEISLGLASVEFLSFQVSASD